MLSYLNAYLFGKYSIDFGIGALCTYRLKIVVGKAVGGTSFGTNSAVLTADHFVSYIERDSVEFLYTVVYLKALAETQGAFIAALHRENRHHKSEGLDTAERHTCLFKEVNSCLFKDTDVV